MQKEELKSLLAEAMADTMCNVEPECLRSYSGSNMSGRKCLSVTLAGLCQYTEYIANVMITLAAKILGPPDYRDDLLSQAAGILYGVRSDRLGYEYIYYWPDLTIPEEYE